jgi:hypothetical protein
MNKLKGISDGGFQRLAGSVKVAGGWDKELFEDAGDPSNGANSATDSPVPTDNEGLELAQRELSAIYGKLQDLYVTVDGMEIGVDSDEVYPILVSVARLISKIELVNPIGH